ncbi:MAG: hypothetical protein WCA10_20140 [Terracidiphilus sp.]
MKVSKERVSFGKVIRNREDRFRTGDKVLKPSEVITVKVTSFVFRFGSIDQLKRCLEFFEKKIHPSSRIPAKELAADLGEDWRKLRGWEVERWFERLPMYLFEEPRRQKVLKALRKALALEEAGKLTAKK